MVAGFGSSLEADERNEELTVILPHSEAVTDVGAPRLWHSTYIGENIAEASILSKGMCCAAYSLPDIELEIAIPDTTSRIFS